MGCTSSKQENIGHKRRENSWYAPLPRSVSAPIHNPPLERPSHAHQVFSEDPVLSGSFVRLLHKKKPIPEHTTSVDKQHADFHHQHQNHRNRHHHHHHEHAGLIELNPSIKKRMHTLNHPNHITMEDHSHEGDDYHPPLQQLQLADFIAHKHKHAKKDTAMMHGMTNQASHEQSSVLHNVPSFRYPEHSPPSKDFKEHDEIDSGGDGDDESMDIMDDWDITNGLRERRKSRFALRHNKDQHVKTMNSEKSLSFNTVVALDNDFTEMGSPAWPKRTHVEHHLRKRKKSTDVLDPDASTSLDGLEEQLHRLCGEVSAEHTQKGLVEVKSPDIESNVPGTCKLSSAFKEVTPGGSQLNTPLRSPSKSPLKESSSPLFDPSILAAFEEAVESVRYCPPDDDWMLVNNTSNEPSSLSSSDKFTWISSEPSSDEEGRQSEEIFSSKIHDHDDLSYDDEGGLLHDDNDTKRQKVDGAFSSNLERFELRCPPRGEDKVVFYFTSLRGVRKTYQDCCALRLILQGLGVDVDERDVWMHLKFREELTNLLGDRGLPVPRLFIKGRYIGGVEEVKQLHEDGLLVRLIEDLPTFGKFRKSCDGCADVRFIPCLTCSGSCKLLDYELDQMIKCFECNENGLIMCPLCCS